MPHPNAPAWSGGAGAFRSAGPAGTNPSFDGWNRPGTLGMPPDSASSVALDRIDKDKTASYMDEHAHGTEEFTGRCAAACRRGLEAGGLDTTGHPGLAKKWASFLEQRGVPVIARDTLARYVPQKGDVAVFEGGGSDRSGHMEIFDGRQWVSDTKQLRFLPRRDYPGGFTIFRFPDR